MWHKAYIVGNLIYDIHPEAGLLYNTSDAWRPSQAISLWAGIMDQYIINNTIYDVHGGINSIYAGPVTMSGNIISNINSQDYHIAAFHTARDGVAFIGHSIFHDPQGDTRFLWNWTSYTNLNQFKNSTGQCNTLCQDTNTPIFINPQAKDFRILINSPAHDTNNLEIDVYTIFYNLYGIDIKQDINGNPRHMGRANDIGALEFIE